MNPLPPAVYHHLAADERLRPLLDTIVLAPPTSRGDIYCDLIRAVVYQQLSGKAAATIHGRFLDLFPDGYPQTDRLLGCSLEDLRAVGLSRQKATYLQNIAAFFNEHRLHGEDWSRHDDEQLIELLSRIKGVGRWTVEMILMFSLSRPDVLPLDDLGIQQAMQGLYGLEGKGKALRQQMIATAEPWRPYRTYACRYLWRWKDGEG